MLLTSMTYREMYDHLAADKYKVDIKQEYLRPKAIKAFRKTSRFPAWELYEYKIPATKVVFQKVCLCRRLQILQICKYSDSWVQNNTPRRVILLFVL